MVGLAAVADLVERILDFWKLIAAREYFGEELVQLLCKLHFEYAVFHAWCDGIGIIPNRPGALSLVRAPPAAPVAGPASPMEHLRTEGHSPFYIAVSRILVVLERIERITSNIQSRADSFTVAHGTVGAVMGEVLAIGLGPGAAPVASHGRQGLRQWAYDRISSIRRVQLQLSNTTTPSDRGQLDRLIREFRGWNQDLLRYLPSYWRDAILNRFLPVTVFDIPYDRQGLGALQEAARNDYPTIANTANLWIGRVEIESVAVSRESIYPPIPWSQLGLVGEHKGPFEAAILMVDSRLGMYEKRRLMPFI